MNLGKTAAVMVAFLWLSDVTVRADANPEIYNFCVRHQGQQVGDGICQTLVDSALRSAGRSPEQGLGREVWRISSTKGGMVICGDFRRVRPGDIVYFHAIDPDRRHHRFSLSREQSGDNHVGVVDSLTLDGVRYFNQNAGHQKMVRNDYFPFAEGMDMVEYIAVYRP